MFDLGQINYLFPWIERGATALEYLGLKNNDSSVLGSIGPLSYGQSKSLKEEIEKLGLKEDHLKYLDQNIEFAAWNMKLWSQYQFDGRARPFYSTAMTVGFLQFVAQVTRSLDKMHKENKHLTLKPLITFSTRLDDTLFNYMLTHERVDTISPSRCEIEMRHNSHDIFLSDDMEDNNMAMEMIKIWMCNNKLN
jgi:hypothetical protein